MSNKGLCVHIWLSVGGIFMFLCFDHCSYITLPCLYVRSTFVYASHALCIYLLSCCTWSRWFKSNGVETYRDTPVRPRDLGVKSHPVVKVVFITLLLIHHPITALRKEHNNLKTATNTSCFILKLTSHQETIQVAVFIGKWETRYKQAGWKSFKHIW